jgi:hypothetical protein
VALPNRNHRDNFNHVWDEDNQEWVPQALSSGVGSDVNVTNGLLDVEVQNASLDVHNFVWDTDLLDWVEQTQAAGGGGGDATAAKQDTQITHLAAIELAVEALEPDGLTDTQLRASAVPVSAASLPLPTGAATAAKQPALGTAGSSSADVLSVQGIASGTALPVSAAALPLPSGAATASNQTAHSTLFGAVDETAPSTDTASSGLNGRLQRIAQRLTSLIALLPAALTGSGNLKTAVLEAIPAGTNLVGRTNLDPQTGNGVSIFRSLDLDESEEEVKGTAGAVYGVWFSNLATSTRFLKFYNDTAANVTVGTTTPVLTLALPGNASDDISGVFSISFGIAFGTAITVAVTTGATDNDTGAPGANEVIVNIFYK